MKTFAHLLLCQLSLFLLHLFTEVFFVFTQGEPGTPGAKVLIQRECSGLHEASSMGGGGSGCYCYAPGSPKAGLELGT